MDGLSSNGTGVFLRREGDTREGKPGEGGRREMAAVCKPRREASGETEPPAP